MFDYTPEGVKQNQLDNAVYYLYKIDKKLKKIKRGLTLLTLIGMSLSLACYKDNIKYGLKNMKGE